MNLAEKVQICLLYTSAALAKKKKVFNRSFNMEVEEAFYDELIAYVDRKVKRRELGLE